VTTQRIAGYERSRGLKIYYKHWQGVVFSINKKKNPAIGQPSQGELNVRPLNCKSTGQKTSSTAIYTVKFWK